MKYLLLASSMALGILGQLLLKKGINASNLTFTFSSIVNTFLNPFVFSGVSVYGISIILWFFVLSYFPLSVAYPALSINYIFIVLISYFLLNEPLTFAKILGIMFITTGVVFLFR